MAPSRTLLITRLSELHFRCRRFILLIKTKEVVSLSYGSRTSSWKPRRWVRLNLIFTMRDIYISFNLDLFPKFSSSHRSTEFKDILPWNISQIMKKIISVSSRIVVSCKLYDEKGCLFLSLKESQWKLRQLNEQNFPREWKLLYNKYQG